MQHFELFILAIYLLMKILDISLSLFFLLSVLIFSALSPSRPVLFYLRILSGSDSEPKWYFLFHNRTFLCARALSLSFYPSVSADMRIHVDDFLKPMLIIFLTVPCASSVSARKHVRTRHVKSGFLFLAAPPSTKVEGPQTSSRAVFTL